MDLPLSRESPRLGRQDSTIRPRRRKVAAAKGGTEPMFSHVMVGASDLARSKTFYDAVLGTLGVPPGDPGPNRFFWWTSEGGFGITLPINGEPATYANGGTIGFTCASPEQVQAWHAAGLAHGGVSCEDPPGPREMGPVKIYLAYLRDPDGNKLCALHRL